MIYQDGQLIPVLSSGENHRTLMILDGVSYYSAFIQLCKVILSRMMNPSVVSLKYDLFWSWRVPLVVLTSLGVC